MVRLYRRSAVQVATLHFLTAGAYTFVWAFWVRRTSAAVLEREDQPVWKTVALVIPLFNFFLFFELGKRIEGMAWRVQLSVVALFAFVPIALMQLTFERAQIALFGDAAVPTRFHWVEWVVIAITSVFWMFVAAGLAIGLANGNLDRAYAASLLGGLAAALLCIAFIARAERRARRLGCEQHANPAEDAVGTGVVPA